jgi:hypothetical protein
VDELERTEGVESARKGWPWSAAQLEESARVSRAAGWSAAELRGFLDELARTPEPVDDPVTALLRVLDRLH